jgi:hypothetical protein
VIPFFVPVRTRVSWTFVITLFRFQLQSILQHSRPINLEYKELPRSLLYLDRNW